MEKSILRQNAIKAIIALVDLGREKMEEDTKRRVYGEPTNLLDLDDDFMENLPGELQTEEVLRDLGLAEIAPTVSEMFRACALELEERDEEDEDDAEDPA